MEFKGYHADVSFDDKADILHGEVRGIRDVVTFQGKSVLELKTAFEESVEEYIRFCEGRGRAPETPFSGDIPLRVTPEVHRAAVEAAQIEGKSLNAWLADAIRQAAAGLV